MWHLLEFLHIEGKREREDTMQLSMPDESTENTMIHGGIAGGSQQVAVI